MQLDVVILAAGKGKRMATNLPKVLHKLGGLSLLARVVKTAAMLTPQNIYVIYGNGGSAVREKLSELPVKWIEQIKQMGTGHAVQQAMPLISEQSRVLVLYGDVPLISVKTLQTLLQETERNALGLLSAEVCDPSGLGRILRDDHGHIIKIVEHRDATAKERTIREINSGIMVCPAKFLKQWLPQLTSQNQQHEYYLTDIVSLAVAQGVRVHGISSQNKYEIQGVNDLWQLMQLERHYQYQYAKRLTLAGVKVMDPQRLDIRSDNVDIGKDVVLDINLIIEGDVSIGEGCVIGANCVLKNTTIGNHVLILPHSIIEGAEIADFCQIGPFARIRPGTVLEDNACVGNFVEIKQSTLSKGSKANHLTYLGDSIIGRSVNIGAGTITCNYDGENKWQTTIDDHAFIGSNVSLVAPVIIGEGATIAAGSTICEDAPPHQLTIARKRQRSISDWKPRQKKNKKTAFSPKQTKVSVD